MRYTVFKFEQDADESSITYVDGLGFIAANNRIRYLRSLRRSSSFLCFLILLVFRLRPNTDPSVHLSRLLSRPRYPDQRLNRLDHHV